MRSNTRWGLVAMLALTFALKLLVLWQLKDHPLTQPESGLDTTAYVHLAREVVGGSLGLGPGLYYVSPFYIYFLAAILCISDSFFVVRLVQIGSVPQYGDGCGMVGGLAGGVAGSRSVSFTCRIACSTGSRTGR